jgi:hypothetical protein
MKLYNILLFLLSIIFIFIIVFNFGNEYYNKECFNPYKQEDRPMNYPNQTDNNNLITIQKYIQTILESSHLSNTQKLHLEDLLNLLQLIQ